MRVALIEQRFVGGTGKNDGSGTYQAKVVNIAEFDRLFIAQTMAANMGFLAVPVDDLPVAIGDIYSDGMFYRDGEIVQQPVQEEVFGLLGAQIQALAERGEFMEDCFAELAMMLLDSYV